MIYAEKYHENAPTEKGVFFSIDEYIPYREKGWEALPEIDAEADELIKIRSTPLRVLKYLAPMVRTGERARDELHRRQEGSNNDE